MEQQYPPIEFASSFHLEVFNGHFLKQAEYLAQLKLLELPEKLLRCWPLIRGIVYDTESICMLTRTGHANQGVMIFRALLEKVVTFYYLQVASDDEVGAYFQYSAQKTYRLMQRSLKVEGKAGTVELKWGGSFDLSAHPEFKAAVDRFTSASGKPKTRWSNTSVETKLAAVQEAKIVETGALEFLLYYIYDDGSEALHGTLYGCLFHLGAFQPGGMPGSQEEIDAHYRAHLVTAYWLGISMLHELNKYLLSFTDQQDVIAKAKEGMDLVNEYMVRALKRPESTDSTATDGHSA